MIIYSLQFPLFGPLTKAQFIRHTQRQVYELAFQFEEAFYDRGLTPESFHADAQDKHLGMKHHVPVTIHAVMINGLYTLRAYGQQATDTLRLWMQIFLDRYPEHHDHFIEQIEHIDIKISDQQQHYQSNNWIPFAQTSIQGGFYVDANKTYDSMQMNHNHPSFALQKALFNNLGTFLTLTDSSLQREVQLINYPTESRPTHALTTHVKGQLTQVQKQAFKICFSTNLVLPHYFSLGQNVGYGNGLFKRITL